MLARIKIRSPERGSFEAMHARCRDMTNKNYGGRGIKVCPRWSGYEGWENFLQDMGPRPEGHTLDRIDPNGHYEPSNCRWATPAQQNRNTRRTILLTFTNRTMCLEDWSRETGIPWTTIYERIHSWGWDVQRALTTPPVNDGNKVRHGSPRRKPKEWEVARERLAALGITGDLALDAFAVRALVPKWDIWPWLHYGRWQTTLSRRWQTYEPSQVRRIFDLLDRLEREADHGGADADLSSAA